MCKLLHPSHQYIKFYQLNVSEKECLWRVIITENILTEQLLFNRERKRFCMDYKLRKGKPVISLKLYKFMHMLSFHFLLIHSLASELILPPYLFSLSASHSILPQSTISCTIKHATMKTRSLDNSNHNCSLKFTFILSFDQTPSLVMKLEFYFSSLRDVMHVRCWNCLCNELMIKGHKLKVGTSGGLGVWIVTKNLEIRWSLSMKCIWELKLISSSVGWVLRYNPPLGLCA